MKLSKRSKTLLVAAVCSFCVGHSDAIITESINYLPNSALQSEDVMFVQDGNVFATIPNNGVAIENSAVKGEDPAQLKDKQRVMAIVETKEGYGLVDTKGQVLVEPKYKRVTARENGHVIVFNNPKVEEDGYIGVKLEVPAVEEDINYVSDGYISFKDKKTKKYGFKDINDDVVIAPQFKNVLTNFREDRAFVKTKSGDPVAIDSSGNELFTVDADYVYPYYGGLAEIQRKASGFSLLGAIAGVALAGIGNSHGAGIGINVGPDGVGLGVGYGYGYNDFWDYGRHNHFYSGVTVVRDKIKRGYIDRDGNVVIDSKLDHVYPMMPFGTIIENDKKLAVVDRKGNFLIPYGDYALEKINLNDPYIALKDKTTEKRGVMNYLTNTQILPFLYEDVDFMNDGFVVATAADDKRVYQMEPTRKEVFRLSKVSLHSGFGAEGFAWVVGDSELGDGFTGYKIINREGQVVFEAKDIAIQDASNFFAYYSAVRVDGKWGVMDTTGKWIVEPIYKDVNFVIPTGKSVMLMR